MPTVMNRGEFLSSALSNALFSPNGAYKLVMQGDANFVVYRVSGKYVMWAGNWSDVNNQNVTANPGPGPYNMGLRTSDGQLVVTNASNQVIWTNGVAGGYSMRLTDEGRVQVLGAAGEVLFQRVDALYRGLPMASDGTCMGNTMTSRNGQYKLMVQGDANVVIYRVSDNAVMWAANWSDVGGASPMNNPGPGPYKLALQDPDGILTLTNASGLTIWSTNVPTPVQILLSDAGKLELRNGAGQVVFARPFALPDGPKLALQAKDLAGADNAAVSAWGPLVQV